MGEFLEHLTIPCIASMYGISTYERLIFMVNVGKYTVRPMNAMGMISIQHSYQLSTRTAATWKQRFLNETNP